jgi:hypothetical protein
MSNSLQSDPIAQLDADAKAAFARARARVAKALAHPDVIAALRAQREAVERERKKSGRKRT